MLPKAQLEERRAEGPHGEEGHRVTQEMAGIVNHKRRPRGLGEGLLGAGLTSPESRMWLGKVGVLQRAGDTQATVTPPV